jgi:hypothetical protein
MSRSLLPLQKGPQGDKVVVDDLLRHPSVSHTANTGRSAKRVAAIALTSAFHFTVECRLEGGAAGAIL